MTRLIDADALKHTLCELERRAGFGTIKDSLDGFKLLIDKAPTVDAVQVVRCWQCSHSEVCTMDDGDVRYCHIYEMQTEDEYYCADGERKDDDDD